MVFGVFVVIDSSMEFSFSVLMLSDLQTHFIIF